MHCKHHALLVDHAGESPVTVRLESVCEGVWFVTDEQYYFCVASAVHASLASGAHVFTFLFSFLISWLVWLNSKGTCALINVFITTVHVCVCVCVKKHPTDKNIPCKVSAARPMTLLGIHTATFDLKPQHVTHQIHNISPDSFSCDVTSLLDAMLEVFVFLLLTMNWSFESNARITFTDLFVCLHGIWSHRWEPDLYSYEVVFFFFMLFFFYCF